MTGGVGRGGKAGRGHTESGLGFVTARQQPVEGSTLDQNVAWLLAVGIKETQGRQHAHAGDLPEHSACINGLTHTGIQ